VIGQQHRAGRRRVLAHAVIGKRQPDLPVRLSEQPQSGPSDRRPNPPQDSSQHPIHGRRC
jgi:hypothetical protein